MAQTTKRYSTTAADRLLSRLRALDNGCIVWLGAKTPFGHGRIARGPRGTGWMMTHRLSWELAHGPVPDGLNVLHRCDNPPCCNPDHLFAGTQLENVRDMWDKGRQGDSYFEPGQAHPSAVLTDEDVRALRRLAPSVGNHAELGRMFGVSKQHARTLALGLTRGA